MIKLNPGLQDWLVDIRRDIHSHPDPSNQEVRTTELIAKTLAEWGVEVTLFDDLTGVLGLIRGAEDGPTVGLRADIDALRMTELRDVPYKSISEGVMHACGHDAHTTIMLGTARHLMESGLAKEMKGNVKFLFQPAEEIGDGAREMIKRGVLDNPHVDYVLACHMLPELEMGRVGVFDGQSHAAAKQYRLTIIGTGSHGGRPHQGKDPVLAGAHWVTAVQSVASRAADPVDSAVVSVGSFIAGDAHNVIPAKAVLSGTTRAIGEGMVELIRKRMFQVTEAVATMFEVECELEFIDSFPPCINSRRVSRIMHEVAQEVLGRDRSEYMKPSTGAEDFAYFALERPSAIVRLGCGREGRPFHPLHSPYFDIDERVLSEGVKLFTGAVRRLQERGLEE